MDLMNPMRTEELLKTWCRKQGSISIKGGNQNRSKSARDMW
jgi:hypothetical protein